MFAQRREPWVLKAACLRAGPEIFYDDDRVDEALLVCNRCPVKKECLAAALDMEGKASAENRYGVRGAMTAAQRSALSGKA